MYARVLALVLALCLALGGVAQAGAGGKLVVYTSMRASLLNKLKEGFEKKNPNITMEYLSGGAGSLMDTLASERKMGKVLADVVWTSEVTDFYAMKKEALLHAYTSPEAARALNPFADFDGSFTAVRLGTLGIAYNINRIKDAPTSWQDLLRPEYREAFSIADPARSGTAHMSIALLVRQFGWEYFEKLAANQAKVGKDAGQVISDVASGKLAASLAVDYIAYDRIAGGAPMNLAYPQEMLVVPSPVAILKSSLNQINAQRFVDYLLSEEGQSIIAGEGTLPVRFDIPIPAKYALPSPADALRRAVPVDYARMMEQKGEVVLKFTEIMKKK